MPLSFVHGIDKSSKINRDYFNYLGMTSGEMYAHLMAAQLRTLYSNYEGHNNSKLWREGENVFFNAIFKGIHNNNMPVGITDDRLNPVYEALRKAQGQFMSASRQGYALMGRKRMTDGIDPLLQLQPITAINGLTIKDGCYTKYSENGTGSDFKVVGYDADCLKSKLLQDELNKHFEKAAHHLVYEFMTDEQAKKLRPTQNWKIGQHQLAVTEIATIGKFDRLNIVEWLRLGIMRNNAVATNEVLDPHDTIEELIKTDITFANAKANQGINIDPITIGILVGLFVTAMRAIAGVIQASKGQEPTAFDKIKGIGTETFSADSPDFFKTLLDSKTGTGVTTTGGVTPPALPIKTEKDNTLLYVGGAIALGLALSK